MQGLSNVARVVVAFTLVACSNESDGTVLDGGIQDGAYSDSPAELDAQNERVDAEDAPRPEDAADEGGGDASVASNSEITSQIHMSRPMKISIDQRTSRNG